MAVMDTGIQFALGIVFIGIVVGVGMITLTSFAAPLGVTTSAYLGIMNATSGLTNLASQLPTVGTIMGVALILIVLFAALGFLVMRKE